MQPSLDVVAALNGLGERSDAWRFIGAFAAAWSTAIDEMDGASDSELDEVERRIGVALPVAVREGYRQFGRRVELTHGDGSLYSVAELDYDEASQMLTFRAAHQAVAYVGVTLADPSCADPATFIYQTMSETQPESWRPFLDRFSLTCVEMVLSECGDAGRFSDGRAIGREQSAALTATLIPVLFARYGSDFDGRRWYAGEDIIVRDDDGSWLAICARTAEALAAFRRQHPGNWVNAF